MIICKFDSSLPAKLKRYLDDPDKLQKSIAVTSIYLSAYHHIENNSTTNLSKIYKGWGDARGSSSWDTRWKAWHNKALQVDMGRIMGAPIYFLINREIVKANELFDGVRFGGLDKTLSAIPIFTSLLDSSTADWAVHNIAVNAKLLEGCKRSNLCQEIVVASPGSGEYSNMELGLISRRINASIENKSNQPKEESNKMKQLFDKVLGQNKDAVALAGKLSVGKAGNAFLLSQVTGKFPWYARLFGAKAKVQDNPFAKLASAQVANALAVHFAPTNKKIAYVADAMLQEAMVDLITNSNQLQSLIEQLEGFAGTITDATE